MKLKQFFIHFISLWGRKDVTFNIFQNQDIMYKSQFFVEIDYEEIVNNFKKSLWKNCLLNLAEFFQSLSKSNKYAKW